MIEQNLPLSICQNSHLSEQQTLEISIKDLISEFNKNKLQECVIFAGLEPMLQFNEIYNFIKEFRKTNSEEVIIYTGYEEHELEKEIFELKEFSNIIMKFGRYKQNLKTKYDEILKIKLISENQYAKKIS